VPPLPYAVIAAQIRHELGKDPDEAFAWFNHEPVAAASLGQVHEARTADGVRVAVKVQFPHMEPIVLGDLENLRLVARALARFLPDLDVVGIANELVRYVGEEVDYVQEGRNAERFHEAFKARPDVIVPRIYWETTTRRVITMDFIDGRRITLDLEDAARAGGAGRARIDRVCGTLVDAFCKQTLEDGFFHADPHPGNFLVTPDGRLGLVDFGCAKPIPIEARKDYVQLAQALVQKDGATMGRCFHALGFRTRNDDPRVLEELGSAYMAVFMAERASDFQGLDFEKLWRDMMTSVRANPVTVPQDFVLLGRVFVALTAITLQFKPNVSYFRILAPYLLGVLTMTRAQPS
jgi:ubiquinone biosynthesis protein